MDQAGPSGPFPLRLNGAPGPPPPAIGYTRARNPHPREGLVPTSLCDRAYAGSRAGGGRERDKCVPIRARRRLHVPAAPLRSERRQLQRPQELNFVLELNPVGLVCSAPSLGHQSDRIRSTGAVGVLDEVRVPR